MSPVIDVAREFISYYSRGGGCSNCGGLPHSDTCFVGRFIVALESASSPPRVPLLDEGTAIGSATNSSPSETPEGYPGLFSCGQCAEKLWAPTALPAGPCIRCGSYKWMPLPAPPVTRGSHDETT